MSYVYESKEGSRFIDIINQETQEILDFHILQHMVESDDPYREFGGSCWYIRAFTNEWITRDIARAILRGLTDRGFCVYERGLFNEDGRIAGSGYGITSKGVEYYKRLCPILEKINTIADERAKDGNDSFVKVDIEDL